MNVQHVAFGCPQCGLRFEADVGVPGAARASETGGPFNRVFWCRKEGQARTLDVNARGFDGRCPTCHEHLDLLADFPLDSCPRCHAPSGVDKTPRHGTSISREGGTGRR